MSDVPSLPVVGGFPAGWSTIYIVEFPAAAACIIIHSSHTIVTVRFFQLMANNTRRMAYYSYGVKDTQKGLWEAVQFAEGVESWKE